MTLLDSLVVRPGHHLHHGHLCIGERMGGLVMMLSGEGEPAGGQRSSPCRSCGPNQMIQRRRASRRVRGEASHVELMWIGAVSTGRFRRGACADA
jgi:hypothetical protein